MWAGAPAVAMIPVAYLGTNEPYKLTAENGAIESYQLGLWTMSILSAIVVSLRVSDRQAKWGTIALGVLAVGALARELDLHIYLNPNMIGDWGVRYRIDWWLDRGVSFWLKLMWVGIGLAVAFIIGFPIWMARGKPRWREARPRLVILALMFLAVGFVADDLLRGRLDPEFGRLLEELGELLGAMFYLGAVLAPERPAAAGSKA